MYEAFYGLREKPFSILPDPDLIYWCQNHRLAFAMLEFGVMNSAGFTVITGEIGCGKTTLVRYLLRKLDDHVTAKPAEIIIGTVNINDPDALRAVVAESGTTEASKADRIANAAKRTITEKMDEDPAFYKKFSALLEETIRHPIARNASQSEIT